MFGAPVLEAANRSGVFAPGCWCGITLWFYMLILPLLGGELARVGRCLDPLYASLLDLRLIA